MSSSVTQTTDLFGGNDPAIAFSEDDQTWTIAPGVLVATGDDNAIESEFDFSRLINNGAILSAGDGWAGVAVFSGDSFVANATGGTIIGATDGIFVNSTTATIDNRGSIIGAASDGIDLNGGSSAVTIANRGSIFGRSSGIAVFSTTDGGVIQNFGAIRSDHLAIEVNTGNELTTTVITNAAGGTIQGDEAAIFVDFAGRVSLDNRGKVIGGIVLSTDLAENDVIANHGKITGATLLGDGNDRFAGTGGTSGAVFGQDGNDQLAGGAGPDNLDGGGGNDRLIGAAGNDRLRGDVGLDTLTGGPGRDRFVFDTEPSATNVDRVTDFAANVDKIVLGFLGLGPNGILAAPHFHIGQAAADASDRIIYNPNSGFLFFDGDGKGGAAEIHFATLAPHLALHNTDFLVDLVV